MVLHSYGMLLPCGIDKFHGTEYVCCLSALAQEPTPTAIASEEEGDDNEVQDEEEVDGQDEIVEDR